MKYKLVLAVDKSVFLGQYKDLDGEIIEGNETELEWEQLSKEQKKLPIAHLYNKKIEIFLERY